MVAEKKWVVAYVLGIGDCAFRSAEPRGTCAPPPVVAAEKFTLVRKDGLVQVGNRSLAGAHLVTWAAPTEAEHLALATCWKEISLPALSVVKGGPNGS